MRLLKNLKRKFQYIIKIFKSLTLSAFSFQPKSMKLLVWLGNPWPNYAKTRHNAGRIMLDQLMEEYQSKPRSLHKQRNAMIGEITVKWEKILTLKPLSYMNRSGAAIKSASSYYKIPVQDILVLHDEIDRVFGKVWAKSWWGHAWHNWLRDTIKHLWTNAFDRIRIGVDRPATKDEMIDYVLGDFSQDQMQWLHSDGYITLRELIQGTYLVIE